MAINVNNCPHRNAQVVYDHSMRMIRKCYDCGEETILTHPAPTASTATTETCITNNNVAIGRVSCSTGYYSTAIGCSSGVANNPSGVVNTNKDKTVYQQLNAMMGLIDEDKLPTQQLDDMLLSYKADYSQNFNTDMRFSDALRKDLEDYRSKLNKAQNVQQSKLERLKEKVEQYKMGVTREQSNNVQSEIDKIRAKYDETLNKYQNNDFVSRGIREAGNVIGGVSGTILQSPPPPPPMPQARKIGGGLYGDNQRGYYQQETPQPQITEFTDIEYVQFMIRNTTFEEKTYKDVEYLDFIFHSPLDQNDSRLNILDSGDVLEWRKIPKNPKLGILSPKKKAIKSIRISVEDLKEARKKQNNES